MKNGKHVMLGAKNTLKCYTSESDVNVFQASIYPDLIDVRYNGHRVLKTRNKDIINQFVVSKVYPVFNLNVNSSFNMDDFKRYKTRGGVMEVTDFEFKSIQYKNYIK